MSSAEFSSRTSGVSPASFSPASWLLHFDDADLEAEFAEYIGTRNNVLLFKMYLIMIAGLVFRFVSEYLTGYWGWPLNGTDAVLIFGRISTVFAASALLLLRRGHVSCCAADTCIVLIAISGMMGILCSDFWRVQALFGPSSTNKVGTAGSDELASKADDWSLDLHVDSDAEVLLVLIAIVCLTHQLQIRTARSLVLCLTTVFAYFALSVPPGMSPDSMLTVFRNGAYLSFLSFWFWHGRRQVECHDRGRWLHTRKLEAEVEHLKRLSAPMGNEQPSEEVLCYKQLDHAIRYGIQSGIEEITRSLLALGKHPEEIDREIRRIRKHYSETAGVSVAYLLSSEFLDLARRASGKDDPTFHDLTGVFFKGENAIGKNYPCPRDGKLGCALIDVLPAEHRQPCTHFLSWTWQYKLSMVRSALELWTSSTKMNPRETFLYMCFFVNNQYRIMVDGTQNGSDDLERIFEINLTRIGKLVALLDTWDRPVYLSRIWTIFEQFSAIKLGIPVTMLLPPIAVRELIAQFERGRAGILRVKTVLSGVDSKNAAASFKADEIKVKQLISQSVGFEGVDKKIVSFMIAWVASELRVCMQKLCDDGEEATDDANSHRADLRRIGTFSFGAVKSETPKKHVQAINHVSLADAAVQADIPEPGSSSEAVSI